VPQGDTTTAHTVTYFNNANGQVLKRDDGQHPTYRYDAQGQRVGDVSTDPVAANYRVSYAKSLAQSGCCPTLMTA
jgi:YD repeat-containing protein